ncbi:MAG: hypothetical protein PVG92_04420, partial [Holophagae bacterium]
MKFVRSSSACLALAVGILLAGCASRTVVPEQPAEVLRPVAEGSWPTLDDDLPLDGLKAACQHSLDYFQRVPSDRLFRFGREQRTAAELEAGIRR